MAITTGKPAITLINEARIDIEDVKAKRWTDAGILAYINDCFTDLATQNCFTRTEYVKTVANQAWYTLLLEPVQVFRVWHNLIPLDPMTFRGGDDIYASKWFDDTATDPKRYIVEDEKVRLVPIPTQAGTTITFAGSPALTETNGAKILGNRWWVANNGGTVTHFVPGDGEVSNPYAADNLHIRYSYYPEPLAISDRIPHRYTLLLKAYITYRAFLGSFDTDEKEQAQAKFNEYMGLREQVIERNQDFLSSAESLAELSPWEVES